MSELRNLRVWFPAKTYGYGWGWPCCWQGWLVLIAYVVLAVGGIFILDPASHPGVYLGYLMGLTAIFCFVCWLKGEKPEWRWGKKE